MRLPRSYGHVVAEKRLPRSGGLRVGQEGLATSARLPRTRVSVRSHAPAGLSVYGTRSGRTSALSVHPVCSDLRKLLYQRTQVSAAQLSRGNDAAVVCSSRTGRGSAGSAAVGWLRQVPSIVETLAIKHGEKSRKEKRHRHGEGEGCARPYPATAESVPAESWSSSRRRV